MSFLAYRRHLQPALDQGLREWLQAIGADLPAHLRPALARALADGKRLRASLLCLVTEAAGGALAAALPRAIAIECIHAASLIHDDYVDGDRQRRTGPATWTLEGARKAVLLGDFLFACAIERMMALSPDDGRVITHAIATVAKGACQEPTDDDDPIGADGAYDRIIFLKTGALFGAATELGALAAGAPPAVRAAARRYGERLGEAYQIADDLYDLAQVAVDSRAPCPPALRPILGRFAPARGPARDATDWRALLPAMHIRMADALAAHLGAARASLADFPPSNELDLLHAASTEILDVEIAHAGESGLRAHTIADP